MAQAGVTTSDVAIIAVEPRLAAVMRKRVLFASIPETRRQARKAVRRVRKRGRAAGRTLADRVADTAGRLDRLCTGRLRA
jgi:hypothetical protein